MTRLMLNAVATLFLGTLVILCAGCSLLSSSAGLSRSDPEPSIEGQYAEVPYKKVMNNMFAKDFRDKYVHFKARYQINSGNNGYISTRADPSEWTYIMLNDIQDSSTYGTAMVPKKLFNALLELKAGDEIDLWAYCLPLSGGTFILEITRLEKAASPAGQAAGGALNQ